MAKSPLPDMDRTFAGFLRTNRFRGRISTLAEVARGGARTYAYALDGQRRTADVRLRRGPDRDWVTIPLAASQDLPASTAATDVLAGLPQVIDALRASGFHSARVLCRPRCHAISLLTRPTDDGPGLILEFAPDAPTRAEDEGGLSPPSTPSAQWCLLDRADHDNDDGVLLV